MTRIKFCGLKRREDIAAANIILPDYVGFVFAKKSKRAVTPEQARALKKELAPEIQTVGVFVNEAPEQVAALLNEGTIDLAQLHGTEDEAYIRELRKYTQKPIIQAFKITTDENSEGTSAYPEGTSAVLEGEGFAVRGREAAEARLAAAAKSSADHILLDSGAGTGSTFDWELLKDFPRPYFLAGGLDPENAAEAVRLLHPFAVDVSSGIETDGAKDGTKMVAFAAAVRKEDEL